MMGERGEDTIGQSHDGGKRGGYYRSVTWWGQGGRIP